MSHVISHNSPSYNEEVIEAGYNQLLLGNFSRRHVSEQAEAVFASFTKSKYARIVSSGFTALQTALVAVGVKNGDEVTLPNIICPSVYHAILSLGAIPHVIDVSKNGPILDMKCLLKNGVKKYCIVPNMFGMKVNIDKSRFKQVTFIEDNAQCLISGCSDWASISIFSFSPTKLVTAGYCGAVVTNEEKVFKRIQLFLDCDYHLQEQNEEVSVPFRIHADASDFQAAMLLAQLERYNQVITYRSKLVQIYKQNLQFPHLEMSIPFRYLIKCHGNSTEQYVELLKQNAISSAILGSHLLSDVFPINGYYPNSDLWKRSLLSLPLHEGLSENDVKHICNILNESAKLNSSIEN